MTTAIIVAAAAAVGFLVGIVVGVRMAPRAVAAAYRRALLAEAEAKAVATLARVQSGS